MPRDNMSKYPLGILGIAVVLGVAVMLSTNRRAIRLRVVGAAFALQTALAVLVLYVPAGRAAAIGSLAGGVAALARLQPGGHPLHLRQAGGARGRRQQFRHRRPAGHHLLRRARLDPLPPARHAVARADRRRCDPAGHRDQQGRIPVRGGGYFRRPDRIAARDSPLHRGVGALAVVHGDDQRHVRRGGHGARRVCVDGHPHRLPARRLAHVRARAAS